MISKANAIPTIAVSDIGRARKFYEETLGFKIIDERSDGVRYEAGNSWFLVYPSSFAGTNKATYLSFDVDNVEKTVKELRDRGVTFEDYDMPGLKTVDGIAEIQGVKGAWFKDLDGNLIAIGERT